MKVGDKVKVTVIDTDVECYWVGDLAVIVDEITPGVFQADFRNQGNPAVADDGLWFVDEQCCVVVEPAIYN